MARNSRYGKSAVLLTALLVYSPNFLQADEVKLSPSGLGKYAYFGAGVSAFENHMLVGAYYDDDKTLESPGVAYIYKYDMGEWQLIQPHLSQPLFRFPAGLALLLNGHTRTSLVLPSR